MTNYNLINLTSSTNLGEVAIFANNVSQGVLFGFGMIALFFIMLLAIKKNADFDESLLASSFLSFILSIILAYGGMLNIKFPIGFLFISCLTALFLYSKN